MGNNNDDSKLDVNNDDPLSRLRRRPAKVEYVVTAVSKEYVLLRPANSDDTSDYRYLLRAVWEDRYHASRALSLSEEEIGALGVPHDYTKALRNIVPTVNDYQLRLWSAGFVTQVEGYVAANSLLPVAQSIGPAASQLAKIVTNQE
jgi:hypothetical protein